jgi:hypothetical protein
MSEAQERFVCVRGVRNHCLFPYVAVTSQGANDGRRSVKKGSSGPVPYQHKRRPRSTLLVSEIRRLARTAQGSRQEGWKLGDSGREGAEGWCRFIVVKRHRYTDISDCSVGLTLGQVRSFDARGRSPHVRSSRPPIVGPRGRGSLPGYLATVKANAARIKCPASESNSMTRRGTRSTCLRVTA